MKKRRLQYNRANLQIALEATQRGVSIYRAARQYCVPETTLRDRARGRVEVDATIGFDKLFSKDEEQKLVDHITYMADIGYGYNKANIQHMAKDYADSLGKNVKAEEKLSSNWFYGFIDRWPNLKRVKPQKLSIYRAKSASREVLDKYYKELASVLTSNNLHDKPGQIYNVDETGISSEHNPPKVICHKNTIPQCITSSRGSTVTIIAAGNALGNSIPPYYVFAGARWNVDFLKDACPGSDGEMSKTGWSNTDVFHNYITKHFAKYVNLSKEKSAAPTLILYDGHKSHISLTLTEWAKKYNVVLFVLPPHTSHITQPLDVAVFGPFKAMYNSECQAYMKRNPGLSVTKYEVAHLTSTPYLRALSAENLISAFRKTGIHPFNNKVITDSQVAPSVIYHEQDPPADEQDPPAEEQDPPAEEQDPPAEDHHSTLESSSSQAKTTSKDPENESQITTAEKKSSSGSTVSDFFQSRTITKAVVNKPKRKFIPPFLSGNLLKKSNVEVIQSSAKKAKLLSEKVKSVSSKDSRLNQKSKVISKPQRESTQPQPSTSGTSKKGKALEILSEDSEGSLTDEDIGEEEKCCVCKKWEPDEIRGSAYISFVNWAKCDFCPHWTHLKTCTEVRVIRRDSVFRCPHCPSTMF